MQAVNIDNRAMSEELVGRRQRQKMIKKERFLDRYEKFKELFNKVGVIFLLGMIISMGVYILIGEIRHNNFLMNIENDPYIPNSVVQRVITHLK